MNKVVSAEQAIASIADGSTVAVCGCENILLPEYLLSGNSPRDSWNGCRSWPGAFRS